MNIFYLHQNQDICSQQHSDKHVVKMITEYVQLLSTCLHYYELDAPYRKTHTNHPCAKWVRLSLENYQWLWRLADKVGKEYTFRYGKQHLSHTRLLESVPYTPDIDFPENRFFEPINATTNHKYIENTVEAYRECYRTDKRSFAKWTNREIPKWFK